MRLHEVENYYIPFEKIIVTYKDYVMTGNLSFTSFVIYNIALVILYLIKIVPIGVLIKAFYQIKFKIFVLWAAVSSLTLEILKLLIGKIIGVNYISLAGEYVLYSFLGLLIGYAIYNMILYMSKRYSDKSSILNELNLLLIYMLKMKPD